MIPVHYDPDHPWRLPIPPRALIGLVAKGLKLPADGWSAREFALKGRLLLTTIGRIAQLTQRKAMPHLARKIRSLMKWQLDDVIRRARLQFGKSTRPESIEVLFPEAHADLWLQALNEVFAEAGIEATAELVPPIQSVMAQGYSRISAMLVQPEAGSASVDIARQVQGIASRIVGINRTTRDMFARDIRQAIEDGLTVAETAERLRQRFSQWAPARINTIARTELQNAWTQGAVRSLQESDVVTHVSVIGCQAREPGAPTYRGQPTCNIQDVPVQDAHLLEFHLNHTGTMVPTGFREAAG